MTKKQQEVLLMVLGNITEYADDKNMVKTKKDGLNNVDKM